MAGFNNDYDEDIISGINITPMVDIMLVLLIIFMLVSSIVDFSAIEVELPKAATGADTQNESVSVVITRTGDYFLSGNRKASFEELVGALTDRVKTNKDLQVVISADKKTYHENVVRVIDTVRKLGITKFAVNVEYLE